MPIGDSEQFKPQPRESSVEIIDRLGEIKEPSEQDIDKVYSAWKRWPDLALEQKAKLRMFLIDHELYEEMLSRWREESDEDEEYPDYEAREQAEKVDALMGKLRQST